MGNVFAHLCPNVPSKLASKYRHLRHSDADIAQICADDTQSNSSVTPIYSNSIESHVKRKISRAKTDSSFGPRIIQEHVNFPFLIDDEIASWIIRTRFMFILRGPPGSGKSYITECIRLRFPTTRVCSADDFWYLESNGLEYQFDVTRVAEAHQWCQEQAYDVAQSGTSPIVIDNTNIRAWETRYYTDLAKKFEYTVIMVIPQTPWRFDSDTLAMKNVHFVGLHTVESKVRTFEHVFPLYYGWLWPGKASELAEKASTSLSRSMGNVGQFECSPTPIDETRNMLSWAWDAFITIVGLPDVHIQLASALGFSDDIPAMEILRHWSSATQPKFGSGLKTSQTSTVPHITAMYARFGRAPGADRYGLSGAVTEALLGRLFTVQVTGLFFSLRTVGVRIRLPTDDLVLRHLWNSDDQALLSSDSQGSNANYKQSPAHTRRPLGCRAHVTLALASDISAVETGLDLLRIVDSELAGQPGEHMAIIPGGAVRRVVVRKPALSPVGRIRPNFVTAPAGDEYMYVFDLDAPQHHRVLFAGAF